MNNCSFLDSFFPEGMTENNHLGYKFFGPHKEYSPDSNLLVYFGSTKRSVNLGIEESVLAAQKIANTFSEPLYLFLSGGVDSEAMALSFLAAKIPFKIAIARYNKGLNDYDINWAISFCDKKNLAYELIEIDLDDFFESGRHALLCEKTRCRSPQFSVHFEMMLRVPGVPIMPWQPPRVSENLDKKLSFGFPTENYFSYYRFLSVHKKLGVPFFFLYTPELIASFLQTPTMKDILNTGKQSWKDYELKLQVYKESGFELEKRPDKWTGFEGVKQHFAKKYNSDLTVFDRLYREPFNIKYPVPKKTFYQIPRSYFPLPSAKII